MKIYLSILLCFVTLVTIGQTNRASFSYFEYKGKDACFEQIIDSKTQYRNPILPGMYPDPSICRRGNDYFLINSTFCYFPGIPIFHSTDLVHWKQIGHVLDRPSQLKLDGLSLSSGVYAPTIRYNEKNQTFYVINTVVGGIGNFIVRTKDPFKGWSEPIKLPEVKGIDPSIFVDDDGKGYIVNSQASEKPRWNGHSVIWIHEFDFENDKASMERQIVVDGGPDTTKHPRWLEGPHIYKENGFYYLMAAEGGTQSGHKEVIFRSKHVKGPYTPAPNNPILTQLGLPVDRKNKVTNVGHADLVKTTRGDWFAVFLGCRPYADDQFNTGRETFMLPVKWVDGFPIILEKGKEVPSVVGKKEIELKGKTMTGNFCWRDEFDSPVLDMKWNMIRPPRELWWKIVKGKMVLDVLPHSLRQQVNSAFLGRRQQHLNFEVSTLLEFTPKTKTDFSGLAYIQNENNYLVIGKKLIDSRMFVILQSFENGILKLIATKELSSMDAERELGLCISVKEGEASFYYFGKNGGRKLLADKVDITHISTKKSKGFIGAYVGMYATGLGY
jgi:alpha-N-arabinofuranosidase